MSEFEKAFRDSGILRDASEFSLCGAEPCDDPARFDVLHSPNDDPAAVWVPLCPSHWAATCDGKRIEYVIEVHESVGAP